MKYKGEKMAKTILLAKLFNVTRQAISSWKKKKDKPIMEFINKYFSDEDIEEFLKSGKMKKMEIASSFIVDEKKAFLSQRALSPDLLRLKLIQMPVAAKEIMISQIDYCIFKGINFTLEYAQSALPEKIPSSDGISLENYKTRYIYYLNNVLTQKEINYINIHKEEIVNLLITFSGLLENW